MIKFSNSDVIFGLLRIELIGYELLIQEILSNLNPRFPPLPFFLFPEKGGISELLILDILADFFEFLGALNVSIAQMKSFNL